MLATTFVFLANAAQQGNHVMEMLDYRGGNFWTSPYRLVMTVILSALIIWLVVRILKSDDQDSGK